MGGSVYLWQSIVQYKRQSNIIHKTNKEQRHLLPSWKYPEVRTTVQSNKEQSTVLQSRKNKRALRPGYIRPVHNIVQS